MNYKTKAKNLGVRFAVVGLFLCMFVFTGHSQSNTKRKVQQQELNVSPDNGNGITNGNDLLQNELQRANVSADRIEESMQQKVARLNETLLPQGSKAIIVDIKGKQQIKLIRPASNRFDYTKKDN